MLPTFERLAAMLASGETTSAALVESCLARIDDREGEGGRAFVKVLGEQARAAAEAVDRARALGMAASPYAGIPISVKDLFDLAGQVTTAGSVALTDAPPAKRDARVIARLRAAGLVILGRTNMTEFAYSGLGLNPHYGTPANPFERETGRIPGGSSSGAVISVTDGMATAGIGTDTGGSCRIPAALSGTVGFKPTAARIPQTGVLPLSPTLDSIGALAPSVSCCAIVDSLMAGEPVVPLEPFPLKGLRLAALQTVVLDDIDDHVAAACQRALSTLSGLGALVDELPVPEIAGLGTINAKGGYPAAEAWAWHRRLIEEKGGQYDPRVRQRIEKGAAQSAADYIELGQRRAETIASTRARCAGFDALVMPTVPKVAPTFAEVETEEGFTRLNILMLRNPSIINFLDGCAVSIPCHQAGEAPVGLMLAGFAGQDRRLLSIARGVEAAVSPLVSAEVEERRRVAL
jgi:aspartyl-tRNA(Asn)/glutamyl-tRNA(Gln) amidotransferase subunit A